MKKLISILIISLFLVSILPIAFANGRERIEKNVVEGVAKELKEENRVLKRENKIAKEGIRKEFKEKIEDLRNATKESRDELRNSRKELSDCRQNKTDNCRNLNIAVRQNYKVYLSNEADRVLALIDRAIAKVDNSTLSEEQKANLNDLLANNKDVVDAVKVKLVALEDNASKEDYKSISMELKKAWTNSNKALKYGGSILLGNRYGFVIKKAEHLQTRLNKVLDKFRSQGNDVSTLSASVEEFNSYIELAKKDVDQAKELLKSVVVDGSVKEEKSELQQARDLYKKAQDELRQAHNILKEIVKNIKEQKDGNSVLESTKEDFNVDEGLER